MDYGKPYRIVAEAGSAPHTYPSNVKLIAIICASLGQTGLPTDPPPPLGPMSITGVAPASGTDGTEVTISGANFGEYDSTCKVLLSTDLMPIVGWEPDHIIFTAAQGNMVEGVPHPITVQRDDGSELLAQMGFAFTAAATGFAVEVNHKGKTTKKASKEAKHIPDKEVGARADTRSIVAPDGTLMLLNGLGTKIMLGPFTPVPGQLHTMVMECRDGLTVVTGGAMDITLLLGPPA